MNSEKIQDVKTHDSLLELLGIIDYEEFFQRKRLEQLQRIVDQLKEAKVLLSYYQETPVPFLADDAEPIEPKILLTYIKGKIQSIKEMIEDSNREKISGYLL